MSSDEPSPGFSSHKGAGARASVAEGTLHTVQIQIERKSFLFALKENPRGRFLRITEEVNGRRDTIIIPAPGLEEFKKALDEMVRASARTPQPDPS